MRFIAYLLLSVILVSVSPVRAQECPECTHIDAWFAENGGACGYHGNRLPSICDTDPECVEWNRRCNAKRDEQRACIARCMAGAPPQPDGTELDDFDRDMGTFELDDFTLATGWAEPPEKIIYGPDGRILIGGRRSAEWCRQQRHALAASDPQRYVGGQIGVVIGLIGPVYVNQCEGPTIAIQKGAPILLGDIIETGDAGRVRIRMFDESEHTRGKGPSFINIGENSALNFESFETFQPEPYKGPIDLIRGSIKVFFKGWKLHGSSYSVKAGIAVCGIRGSEVIVRREPSDGSVQVGVIEGHAWFGNRESRDIRYLEAGQWVQDKAGGMTAVQAMSRADWDSVLVQDGLDLDGEAIDLPRPDCGQITGRWRWFTGSIVDFTANKRWRTPDGANQGSWRCTVTDRGNKAVVVTPDAGGWEDVVVVDPDGAALSGQSRTGVDVSAVRIYP